VWFKNLRWRAIPADETLVSENLTPMPVSEAALKKEQARIQELLNPKPKPAKKSALQHHELKRFKAEEAHQGVAVDDSYFYAITNAAIGKYRKDNGERAGGWKEAKGGRLKHLNAGLVLDGKLYCAHSNYPEMPMKSSVEIWDAKALQHLESMDLTDAEGSLTWVDRREGRWDAGYAQYAKTGDPAKTRIVTFDAQWKKLGELTFPAEVVAKFGKNSSSGGSFGPDGHLFITGHDAQELYVLDLPAKGDTLILKDAFPISAHGQAFAWDRGEPGILYSIDRKTSEVIVSRLQ
jgi:hypothetical protein